MLDGSPLRQDYGSLIEDIFCDTADFEFTYFRDAQDAFTLQLLTLNPAVPSLLEEHDLFVVIPLGGRWGRGLGLESIFGIPFEARGYFWIAIGAERIIAHPTRIAYPVSKAYVFCLARRELPNSAFPTLATMLHKLADQLRVTGLAGQEHLYSAARVVPPHGEIRTDPASPEHRHIAAAIIEQAARYYDAGTPFFFRTLLFADSLHPAAVLHALSGRLTPESKRLLGDPHNYLVGVPPWIKASALERLLECIQRWLAEHFYPGRGSPQ